MTFSKVSKLVQISTQSLVMPMQFFDDLNLTSCAFMSKNYQVTHETKTGVDDVNNDCQLQYLIKLRNWRNQQEKHWAVSLRVLQSVNFHFSEQI